MAQLTQVLNLLALQTFYFFYFCRIGDLLLQLT